MEDLLKSVGAEDVVGALKDMGVTSVDEVAECEPSDLVDDLGMTKETASKLIAKAKEAAVLAKNKSLIQGTWKAVQDSLSVEATKLFYQRLFVQYPQVKPMFKDADMDGQAEKLFKTVSLAVDYLEDVESLIPKLEELGARHANEWGAERAHYDAVGECLIWTLKTGLGEAWNDSVADAWTWVYGVIAGVMADAGDKAHFERRKAIVQKTWKVVEESLNDEATKLFYKRLFEEYPSVIPLFEHGDMESQAKKLYKTVTLAVEYLDDVDSLIPVLEELGARHAREWKAERAHYDAVGECLIWTLKTGLGEMWTDEVADAWTWVYGVIAKTMANAGEEAAKST